MESKLLKYLLVIFLIQQTNLKINFSNKIVSFFSEISLNIKGTGYQKLFDGSIQYPSQIIINGISQDHINNSYELNCTNNEIKLIWNYSISNCERMFKNCLNLTNINFSLFDTFQITDMSYMFSGCTSLSYLDLSNFDTTQVKYMSNMFSGCSSLLHLNLSSFNTSQVISMSSMFTPFALTPRQAK